jgi:hypothetical protein
MIEHDRWTCCAPRHLNGGYMEMCVDPATRFFSYKGKIVQYCSECAEVYADYYTSADAEVTESEFHNYLDTLEVMSE